MDDDEIRILVKRLSRVGRDGGATIERAAIVAEGSDLTAVVAWILSHGGQPEAAVAAVAPKGLHGSRLGGGDRSQARAALRYVLPSHALN